MNNKLGMSVDIQDRMIIVQFDRKTGYLKMTPQQAVSLADAILQKAMTIADEMSFSPIIIPPGKLDS